MNNLKTEYEDSEKSFVCFRENKPKDWIGKVMGKMEDYRQTLKTQKDVRSYLLENSNLPGPRGNLELAHAAAIEIPAELLIEWTTLTAVDGPVNTPLEFLTFCGVLGQGRLFNEGNMQAMERIIKAASDSRWRTREAAAAALQIIGKKDIQKLLESLPRLAEGNPYEQRCAVAGICEPVLLKEQPVIQYALNLLDRITESFFSNPNRKDEVSSH